MEKKPKQIGFLSKGALLLVVALIVSFGLSLLQVWDCGVCGNARPDAFVNCPYCNHTGKQILIQRLRVPAKYIERK